MKLLVDMNLSPRWSLFLAASKVEAVHWSRVGAVTAPDTEIMAYARAHGYIVLTHDLDFSAILAATGGTKPSVMQIRSENLNPDVVGEKIVSASMLLSPGRGLASRSPQSTLRATRSAVRNSPSFFDESIPT
jgi:predicted nuclease of predicted toxin-antitoxin system